MTPHFLKWSFGPKIESVEGICHQTDSMNRFYLDVKTGPKGGSYGNKILYKNLKFFDKIFVAVEDFVTLLMGKKSC